MAIIDGENEDAGIGTPLPLGTVGRAHVEISAVRNGLVSMQGMTGKENKEKRAEKMQDVSFHDGKTR